MACKDKKTLVRIDPKINHLLAIAAKINHKHGYQLIEEIVINWINHNHPDLIKMDKDLHN